MMDVVYRAIQHPLPVHAEDGYTHQPLLQVCLLCGCAVENSTEMLAVHTYYHAGQRPQRTVET